MLETSEKCINKLYKYPNEEAVVSQCCVTGPEVELACSPSVCIYSLFRYSDFFPQFNNMHLKHFEKY